MSADDFALVEQDLDGSTRVLDVHGTIDAVRVASVLNAVAAAPADGVVLDLTRARLARPDDLRALAGGLVRLRAGQPVVLVSADPALGDVLERLGVGDYIEVAPSQVLARATLIVDRVLEEPGPVLSPAARRPRSTRVRLDGLDGVARVRVRDGQGALLLRGTSAHWERREAGGPAVLVLVVLDAGAERAAFVANAVREVTCWMSDDGTLGATVVVDGPEC
jgi:anti-anti-sigma regulatory factor